MALWQFSMYLSDRQEDTGWSEQVTQDVSSPSTAFFINTLADAKDWANRRAAFLSVDAQVDGVVARQIGSRLSFPYWFTGPVKGNPGIDNPNNLAEVSIDMRMVCSTGQGRVYWVRSVPDVWINSGVLTTLGQAAADGPIKSYLNWLIGHNGIGIRTTNQPKIPASVIGNIPPVGNIFQNIQVTVPNYPNAPVLVPKEGNLVRITGPRGIPYVNGLWKVTSPAGAAGGNVTFQLYNSAKYQIGGPYTGFMQLVNPSVVGFISARFDRVGRHKTGKIFNQQRGRGSAKVLHSR